jgi:hypothetical protein
MSWRDLPGHIVMATATLGVAALLWLPPPASGLVNRPVRVHPLIPGDQLDLIVPVGAQRVRVLSIAEPPTDLWGVTGPTATYRIALTWLDEDGEPLHTELITHHTASSRSARVAPDAPAPPAVLDPRAVDLLVPTDPPPAGLRLALIEGVAELGVRAYWSGEASGDPETQLVEAHERRTRSLTARLRRPSWHEVSRAEALALIDERWTSLAVRDEGPDLIGTVMVRREPPDALARRATGLSLRPDDAAAWLVQGPVVLELVALGPLEHAELWAIAEDVGDVPMVELPVPREGRWAEGATVRRLHLPTAGETSLHLHARGTQALHGLVLVHGADDPVPPDVESSSTRTWFTVPGAEELISVVPTYIYETVYTPTGGTAVRFSLPATPTRQAARLDLRPLRGQEASHDAHVELVLRGADGVEHTSTVTLPWSHARYERIGPTRTRWDLRSRVGEQDEHYVWWGPGPAELIVRTDDTVLVSAALHGPLRGDRSGEDATGTTRLRFVRDAITSWTPLPPANLDALQGQHAALQLSANLRRELVHPEERRYHSISLSGRHLAGEPFLVSLPEGDAGLVYCRYAPSPNPQRLPWGERALHEHNGQLALTLWAPRSSGQARLGDTWSLQLDGLAWRTERFETPVRRLDDTHGPARSLILTGPAGMTAWVRTWTTEGQRCAEPYRPFLAHLVPAGGTISFRAQRTEPDQHLSISGYGRDPVAVQVILDPLQPEDRPFTEVYTPREQHLDLRPEPGVTHTSLLRPWLSLPPLTPRAIVLREDLGDTPVQVRVTNEGAQAVWLRFAMEDPPANPPEGEP